MEILKHSITDYGLPALLRYGDRNAMNFSIENRVPFLNIKIAEFLFLLTRRFFNFKKWQYKIYSQRCYEWYSSKIFIR